MGNFLIIPLIVGAFAGFALLSGVVDLSIGSMLAFSKMLDDKVVSILNPFARAFRRVFLLAENPALISLKNAPRSASGI